MNYNTIPYAIFFRFLKNYNICINPEIIEESFKLERKYFIDRLAVIYLTACRGNGIDTKIKRSSYYYLSILDYLWSCYVYQHYDKIKGILDNTNLMMPPKEALRLELEYSSGKTNFHRLKPKIKKIYSKANLYDFIYNEKRFIQKTNSKDSI